MKCLKKIVLVENDCNIFYQENILFQILGFSISYDVTTFISFDYTGNVAQYLQTAVQANPATGFRWHYDFHKVRTSQQHHELSNYILYFSVYNANLLIQNSISF